ncbi:DNA-directed RNA polymerase I subunit Rpa43p [Trichomonascus vanleenenianus]|uniref:DNA-directed RNA polymerase I subunit RPA43 n=1 Tax=Trichomonascus vanleenenianus TaxID=2268995 RepID=UPI003EC96CBD
MPEHKNRKRKADGPSEPKSKRRRHSMSQQQPASTNTKDSNGISQCFHKVSTSLYVSLAPVYVNRPLEGIQSQHLDPLLMSYFPSARGVVLAYTNVRLCGQDPEAKAEGEPVVSKIMYDSPFSYLWVSVDFLIWKPMAGDTLEGWINLQSPSHIGLLIHDTFNATIKRDAIPVDWSFVRNEIDESQVAADSEEKSQSPQSLGYWVDGSGKRIDDKLKFSVKAFNVSTRMVSIQGTMLKPGEVREDLTDPTAKKSSHVKFDEESLPQANNDDNDDDDEQTAIPESAIDDGNGAVEYGEDSDSD